VQIDRCLDNAKYPVVLAPREVCIYRESERERERERGRGREREREKERERDVHR